MNAIDEPVGSALRAFASATVAGSLSCRREREAVSMFAFGSLLDQVDPTGSLMNSSQTAIEVPVPQVAVGNERFEGKKRQVCKDLVIWPEPRMTCWDDDGDPTVAPTAILEWKFGVNRVSEYDVDWLEAFTTEYSDCTGYAVAANPPGGGFALSCTRITADRKRPEWVHVTGEH